VQYRAVVANNKNIIRRSAPNTVKNPAGDAVGHDRPACAVVMQNFALVADSKYIRW
jgi:hypothetical protein